MFCGSMGSFLVLGFASFRLMPFTTSDTNTSLEGEANPAIVCAHAMAHSARFMTAKDLEKIWKYELSKMLREEARQAIQLPRDTDWPSLTTA